MKKLESTWYNMAIVLTGIAVVAGAALGYVNSITSPTIQDLLLSLFLLLNFEFLDGR